MVSWWQRFRARPWFATAGVLTSGILFNACGGGGTSGGLIPCTDHSHCSAYGLYCDVAWGYCVSDSPSSGGSGSGSGGAGQNAGGTVGGDGSTGGTGLTPGSGGTPGTGGAPPSAGGTESSGGTPSTGGSVGVGGTVAIGGSVGAGGTVGGPSIRTALPVSYGYVDASSNDVGIRGWWYTYTDEVATTIYPASFESTPGPICVSGSVPAYADPAVAWGAVVALNLNQGISDLEGSTYNAVPYGVVGFGFTLTGSVPQVLQINMKQTGSTVPYCKTETGAGAKKVYFDQLIEECWIPGSYSISPNNLYAFEIQIGTGEYVPAHTYDFCIENLHALLE